MDERIKEIRYTDLNEVEQLVSEALAHDILSYQETEKEIIDLKRRFITKHRIRTSLWSAAASIAAILILALFLWHDTKPNNYIYIASKELQEVKIIDSTVLIVRAKQENNVIVKTKEKTELRKINVPTGKDYHLTLPDGTEIWLNENSQLIYPKYFSNDSREVNLRGEAYFKVRHDPYRPFIVKTNRIAAKVLGTEFNVKCYNENSPHVTLVSGSVMVFGQEGSTTIKPGDDASMNDGKITVKVVNTDDYTCWREGIVLFDDATMRDILIQIGSWYGINVICHDNDITQRRLRFVYDRSKPITEVLKMLNFISKAKVKIKENTIFVE